MPTGKDIPEEIKKQMVEAYCAGVNLEQAGKSVGLSATACRNALRRAGVARRPNGHVREKAVNERYFDSVDSEEKAYWLGFFAADGNVTDDGTVQLGLARVDRAHIEMFKRHIGSEHKIYDYTTAKGHLASKLCVYSREMANSLDRVGITPRKTFTVKPWDGPAHLLSHYWRGYVDGDGCIRKNKKGQWCLKQTGNHAMMAAFAEYVSRICGDRPAKVQDYGTWAQVDYCGNVKVGMVLNVLYGDATIALERKWDRAKEVISLAKAHKKYGLK